jgi:hypothetical protein
MKMNREICCGSIDKSYHCLAIFLHAEGGPWAYTIITDKLSFLESWVDLLLKRLDFDLIVVDILASGRIVVRTDQVRSEKKKK